MTSGCIGAAERAKTRKFTVAPAGAAHGVYREKCFYPVVVNPAGRLGDEGEKLLRRLLKTIAKKASDLSVGVERSSGFLRKLLSIAFQRYQAFVFHTWVRKSDDKQFDTPRPA